MEEEKINKEILEEALKKFTSDNLRLTNFIISYPDTDLITFNQVKEIIRITKLKQDKFK